MECLAEIYGGKHFDVKELVDKLHSVGFSVRLCTVMTRDRVDSVESVHEMIRFSKGVGVEQLTLMPVSSPHRINASSEALTAASWIASNHVSKEIIDAIRDNLSTYGDELTRLAHGAIVYDVNGQNVCLSNCLRKGPEDNNEVRNLIFHPDGHLRTDWTHEGSIVL
jgi:hypothetical protein